MKAALAIAVAVVALAGCGGASLSASDVASKAGALSCDQSDYYIVYRTDGSKHTIYNCELQSGKMACVTVEGGIASDATDQVRIVFANALGNGKPSCLNG